MSDFNKTVHEIEHLLLQEQSKPITSRADIAASQLKRKEISTLLDELHAPYDRLQSQFYSLPIHPDEGAMNWAESVLSMESLTILVLDTTGLDEKQHDIIRIHARSVDGVILDQFVKPTRQLHANTAYTGIDYIALENAPTLTEVWERTIKPTLSGQFVVSYGFPFVEKMLKGNAQHYGLSRLPFRGEDVIKQAKAYFYVAEYGYDSGLKLPDACARIGYKIPTNPPLAADRALGCLKLLQAMANGVSASKSEPAEMDDHPF